MWSRSVLFVGVFQFGFCGVIVSLHTHIQMFLLSIWIRFYCCWREKQFSPFIFINIISNRQLVCDFTCIVTVHSNKLCVQIESNRIEFQIKQASLESTRERYYWLYCWKDLNLKLKLKFEQRQKIVEKYNQPADERETTW